jgi:hypothetical protein
VDFSALSRIIMHEPFHLHFWGINTQRGPCTLSGIRGRNLLVGELKFQLIAGSQRLLENDDWLSEHSNGLSKDDGTIICGTGGGNIAKNYYKVSYYAHTHETIGKFDKRLLHRPEEQERR